MQRAKSTRSKPAAFLAEWQDLTAADGSPTQLKFRALRQARVTMYYRQDLAH